MAKFCQIWSHWSSPTRFFPFKEKLFRDLKLMLACSLARCNWLLFDRRNWTNFGGKRGTLSISWVCVCVTALQRKNTHLVTKINLEMLQIWETTRPTTSSPFLGGWMLNATRNGSHQSKKSFRVADFSISENEKFATLNYCSHFWRKNNFWPKTSLCWRNYCLMIFRYIDAIAEAFFSSRQF